MKILLVEDEQELADSLKHNLEAECYAVDWAPDGEKGSFMARTNEYDVIILDYIMPKKDGAQVCEEIRKDGKDTPIIMLTVKSELSAKINLFNLGADDYLTKPFSYEELLARLKAILRRPKKIQNEVITIGDIAIDPANQEVKNKKTDKTIYLTRREFMLFEYLARHKGSIVSRGSLMEHVWDMNADPFSNTIESHILNVRRKLEKLTTKKLIETIPSRGYKIS